MQMKINWPYYWNICFTPSAREEKPEGKWRCSITYFLLVFSLKNEKSQKGTYTRSKNTQAWKTCSTNP